MSWDLLTLPIRLGGLGVDNILYMNLTLLFKWWWRFSSEIDTLRKRVVYSVHDILDYKASMNLFQNCTLGVWGQFKLIQKKHLYAMNLMENGLLNKVGDKRWIYIWEDKWCADVTMKETFPRLYSISTQHNKKISEVGYWSG